MAHFPDGSRVFIERTVVSFSLTVDAVPPGDLVANEDWLPLCPTETLDLFPPLSPAPVKSAAFPAVHPSPGSSVLTTP